MFFKKKSPKRLYYPTRSRWYNRPRKHKQVVLKRQRGLLERITKKTRDVFKRFTYVVVIGSILLGLSFFFLFSTYFSITEIKIARENFYVDSKGILNELNGYIGENLFFFPKKLIVQKVQEYFPEFSSVHVSKSPPGTLTLHLESYPIIANVRTYYSLSQPSEVFLSTQEDAPLAETVPEVGATVSQAQEDFQQVEQKGLLNQVGQILFDQEENLELMTITINNLNQPLEDRQTVIFDQNMEFILNSINYFNTHFGFQINHLEYLPIAREIHLKNEEDTVIWLSLEKDYQQQLDKLLLIYEEAELDQQQMAYIDLRVNEKVIWCPKGTECDQFN